MPVFPQAGEKINKAIGGIAIGSVTGRGCDGCCGPEAKDDLKRPERPLMGALPPSSPTRAAMPGVTEELALAWTVTPATLMAGAASICCRSWPVLAILAGVTCADDCYLVGTQFATVIAHTLLVGPDFFAPAGNYICCDGRPLHQSLWTQAKLSIATVALHMLIGSWSAALLVHREPQAGSFCDNYFLVPMVFLRRSWSAIIWKVLCPDISPFWWLFHSAGLAGPAPRPARRLACGDRGRRYLGRFSVTMRSSLRCIWFCSHIHCRRSGGRPPMSTAQPMGIYSVVHVPLPHIRHLRCSSPGLFSADLQHHCVPIVYNTY